jgi:hypothetical protein
MKDLQRNIEEEQGKKARYRGEQQRERRKSRSAQSDGAHLWSG